MFCESYRQPLMNAAASGEDLPHALAAHLAKCAGCAEAFGAEESLLALIDSGLRRNANANVPPSLIAGVRLRVEANNPAPMVWKMMWKWALAFAAVLVMVGGLAVRVALRNSATGSLPEQTNAALTGSTSRNAPASETQSAEAVAPSPNHQEALHRRVSSNAGGQRSSEPTREVKINSELLAAQVLTAPGEAAGLEQYIQQLRMRSIHVVAREEVKSSGRLEISDVEIAELDLGVMAILPLDGAK